MSDAGRKGMTDSQSPGPSQGQTTLVLIHCPEISESVTPESSKSQTDKAKEGVT